jgi:hypothetical protein
MERPIELVALMAFVALIALLFLGPKPGSLRRQAAVGGAIGAASALAVATQQSDLIPDGLELHVAVAGLVVLAVLAAIVRLRVTSS